MSDYLYGYGPAEQERLLRQARYWKRAGLFDGVEFRPGEAVLEIGCGAGGVLGVIHELQPAATLSGIDVEPRQVEYASAHLRELGAPDADVVAGDATELPWVDGTFDTVWMSWFLEHLVDPRRVLEEARRVLKRGGRIVVCETDYSTFKVHPESPNYDYLEQAQYDYFERHGCATAGRLLGPWLTAAGFVEVQNVLAGFHHYQVPGDDRLSQHANYVAEFIEPTVERLATSLDLDADRLQLGVEHLRSVGADPRGAMTQIVYRALARRAG